MSKNWFLGKTRSQKIMMETPNAQDVIYDAVVPPVTQDVVRNDEDNLPVSSISIFPTDLDNADSSKN